MASKAIAIINGSTRPGKNSYIFAQSLKMIFEEKGYSADINWVMDSFRNKMVDDGLLQSIKKSRIIGVVTPLYADFLTYPLTWLIADLNEKHRDILKGKKFFGISQCAFPNWELNRPSLNALKLFADESGLKWLGGLGYGGAAFIDGKPFAELGKTGKKLLKAFELAAEAVTRGEAIPGEAQEILKIEIPRPFLRPLAWYLNRRVSKLYTERGIKNPAVKAYWLDS